MSVENLHSGSWVEHHRTSNGTERFFMLEDHKDNSAVLLTVAAEPDSKKVRRALRVASIIETEEPSKLKIPIKIVNLFRRKDHKIPSVSKVITLTLADDFVRSDSQLQEVLKEKNLPAFNGVKQKAPLP